MSIASVGSSNADKGGERADSGFHLERMSGMSERECFRAWVLRKKRTGERKERILYTPCLNLGSRTVWARRISPIKGVQELVAPTGNIRLGKWGSLLSFLNGDRMVVWADKV